MTLADVLERLLAERPDQTSDELYRALGRVQSKVRDVRIVTTVLRGQRDRFVCSADGRWRLPGDIDADMVDVDAPAEPACSMPIAVHSGGSVDLERELADRLRGCRMVCEIGLDAELHERVEDALKQVLSRTTDVDRVGRTYPALLAVYLVGHGIYHYRGGSYWNSMTVPGLDRAGVAFEAAMLRLGLETFEDMVAGDGAHRFVGPIVAHGGIPKYSLGDYFSLLARGLRRATNAGDLLMIWRSQKTTFTNIDRPVRRFMLFGGDLAVDYIDRSIDLFREHARTGVVLRPDQIGLPPYVVTSFRKFIETSGKVSIAGTSSRESRAQVVVDPWDGSGPVAELPIRVDKDVELAWRVYGEGQLERVPTSSHAVRRVRLRPSKTWTVELVDGGNAVSEAVFEGLDLVPALLFDPGNGGLLRSAAGIRMEVVWVLAPEGTEIEGIRHGGDRVPVRIIEELPPPTSSWSGFEFRSVALDGLRAITLRESPDHPECRIVVRSVAESPRLEGDLVANVMSASGLPVYASSPRLFLPTSDSGMLRWRVRISGDQAARDLNPDELNNISDGHALPMCAGCTEVDLVVRGPLGADLRTSFVVAPSLSASVPERLLFPHEAAVVHLSSSALQINGEGIGIPVDMALEEAADRFAFSVADVEGRSLDLVARVSRVLWSIVRARDGSADFGVELARLAADELSEADPPRLAVRIGTADHLLRVVLTADGDMIQQSGQTRAGGADGRWVFDLSRFSDTVMASDSARLSLVLWVGERPVTVAAVRPSFDVTNLRATSEIAGEFVCVNITYAGREMKNRVARLWSLDRPWQPPITQPVPSDADRGVSIYGEGTIPLGRYLVELSIDDGWSAVTRPRPGAPNTTRLGVGSPTEMRNRPLPPDDPFSVLEAALLHGHYPRHLDSTELAGVAPAATEALLLMLRGELLYGQGSRQFEAVANVALADCQQFTVAVLDLIEDGRANPGDLPRLAVALGHQLRPAPSLSHSAARRLWDVGPAIASALEFSADRDDDRTDRIREFTGWDPDHPVTELPVGTAVEQVYLGRNMEQLDAIQRAADLLPRRVLEIDSYAAATFEWLVADKADPGIAERWWSHQRSIASGAGDRFPFARPHLSARVPPPGTERWAGLPEVTLAAALEQVSAGDAAIGAGRALMQAIDFAPRLVARDLVLARALLLDHRAHRQEPTS